MIFIRCDANPNLGMGHLVRCRALAGALVEEGQSCTLVGPSTKYKLAGDDEIFSEWICTPFEQSPVEDARNFVRLLSTRSSNSAVVDDYRIDSNYQMELRDAEIKWLQFNGNPKQPLWANLVLNPSPEANVGIYKKAIRCSATQLLLGPKFAILRPEFNLQEICPSRNSVRKILVTFGGGDDRGGILTILKTLLPSLPNEIQFLVMSGEHNPRNTDISKWISSHCKDRVQLSIHPKNIAQQISTCDLAIMAGGSTAYEVNFYGLPMLLIAISDNQIGHSKAWQKTGLAKYLGELEILNLNELLAETRNALRAKRHSESENARERLVDGFGRKRVAQHIVEKFGL